MDYWNKYKHLWRRDEIPAKSLLLREGALCGRLYLIRQGCIRGWFNHGDREICFQFFFEGDIAYAPESFRLRSPSPFSLETIEPCVLYSLDPAGMETIREDLSLYNQILDKVVTLQSEDMRHFFSFLKDTPRQRYENLLRDRPVVLQRVPLLYVASYLGITQVSLSRIRNSTRAGGK